MTTIVKAVQTCAAYPSAWDAWTDDGRYLYLRYRYGHGTAHHHRDLAWYRKDGPPGELVAQFNTGERRDGAITLEQFCANAGITLALTESNR
jgi:hypothetical protein